MQIALLINRALSFFWRRKSLKLSLLSVNGSSAPPCSPLSTILWQPEPKLFKNDSFYSSASMLVAV